MDENGAKMDREVRRTVGELFVGLAPYFTAIGLSVFSSFMVYREERLEARHERQQSAERIGQLERVVGDLTQLTDSGFGNLSIAEGVRRALDGQTRRSNAERDRQVRNWIRQFELLNAGKDLKIPPWE